LKILVVEDGPNNMEGFEATRRIKEIAKDVPIIAVTSYSMDDVREEINKAGFFGLIQKPINPRTIVDEIKKIMNLGIL
jgi:CheY-like chemotaxis protein